MAILGDQTSGTTPISMIVRQGVETWTIRQSEMPPSSTAVLAV